MVCCRHWHGVRNYLAVADHPWQSHHICSGRPGPGFPNLQVSASSGGPTLQQTLTSVEVPEPPAHLWVENGPCQIAGLQLWKCPRRARHHWTGRALAQLLPTGRSYSFSFSPPVAVPNAWLLCLGQGDLSMIPSGLQVGAG